MEHSTERADFAQNIDDLLNRAFTEQGKLDDLMRHYRVTGIYHYSMMNSFMIAIQGGTLAQSYKHWQALGRQVRKGEKARIQIWRPAGCSAKTSAKTDTATSDTDQADTTPRETADGRRAFWLCKVFDVSQTEGEPLKYDHNSAVVEGFDAGRFVRAVEALGFSVVCEMMTGPRGYTDGSKIALSSLSNDTDKVKTLFHEAGHCLLEHTGHREHKLNHDAREVEAEIVSALCCSFFGVPYELSADYIANYKAGAADISKTKCIKAAQKIIAGVVDREQDPEKKLRAMWTSEGVPEQKQNAIIESITAAAQPGAMVGPFVIGATVPVQAEFQLA
jgi:antirestriction protein ArdC